MNFFHIAAIGTGTVVFIFALAASFGSVALNIYNLVIAVRGFQAYPHEEPCAGGDNLRIFLIGVIGFSSVVLFQIVLGCCCGPPIRNQNGGEATQPDPFTSVYSSLVSTFGLVWSIIGTVWLSNASACQASGQDIFFTAMRCLIIFWVCWGINIVLLMLICSACLCALCGSSIEESET